LAVTFSVSGFDFEADHAATIEFHHEIHFVSIVCAPMPDSSNIVITLRLVKSYS
jgi:hypothetical protein